MSVFYRGPGTQRRIILPKGRSEDYAIWRACERHGIKPPNVEVTWTDCDVNAKAELIAYNQIRELEENESLSNIFA